MPAKYLKIFFLLLVAPLTLVAATESSGDCPANLAKFHDSLSHEDLEKRSKDLLLGIKRAKEQLARTEAEHYRIELAIALRKVEAVIAISYKRVDELIPLQEKAFANLASLKMEQKEMLKRFLLDRQPKSSEELQAIEKELKRVAAALRLAEEEVHRLENERAATLPSRVIIYKRDHLRAQLAAFDNLQSARLTAGSGD